MSDRSEIAVRIARMAEGVFLLEDKERVAAYADEVVEMLQTVSSMTLEKTQEPFPLPAVAPMQEEER